MFRALLGVLLVSLCGVANLQAEGFKEVSVLYVQQRVERPPVLANLLEVPETEGLAGAQLAIADSSKTGRFTKQRFVMRELIFDVDEGAKTIIEALKMSKERLIVLDLPTAVLEKIINTPVADDRLLFNVGSADNQFRTKLCGRNLLHTLPSRSMLTDALTQYLIKKRWSKWVLIEGPQEGDTRFAKALEQSAKKFGAKIVKKISWDGGRDARRSAQAEVPGLTQGGDYDVLMVADEWGDFGEYLMYRTWDPRPVAGTQGLFPIGWYWTIEQWGATQLQSRFFMHAKRRMNAKDYAAWAAVRSISEATTRTGSVEYQKIADYIQGPEFELGAYKGRKLSYRSWSGQLRQPIAVTAARSLVTQSPQEGYLHRVSELDTLGFDKPEVHCQRN